MNDALLAANQGMVTIVVLLDYSAAFDTVDNAIALDILEKNSEYRIFAYSGSAVTWRVVHSQS